MPFDDHVNDRRNEGDDPQHQGIKVLSVYIATHTTAAMAASGKCPTCLQLEYISLQIAMFCAGTLGEKLYEKDGEHAAREMLKLLMPDLAVKVLESLHAAQEGDKRGRGKRAD